MKKITGKVVSLVLALALVVTSFSANFAFASTKSTTGTVSIDEDAQTIYLANGGTDDQLKTNLSTWLARSEFDDLKLESKDHQAVTNPEITAISHSSGDKLVSWDGVDDEDSDVTLNLKKSNSEGTEVLNVQFEGTIQDPDTDDDITLKGKTTITIKVLDEGDTVVGKWYGSDDDRTGKEIADADNFASKNDMVKDSGTYVTGKGWLVDTADFGAYYVKPGTDALATYVPMTTVISDTAVDDIAYNVECGNDSVSLTAGADGKITADIYDEESAEDAKLKDIGADTGNVTVKFNANDAAIEAIVDAEVSDINEDDRSIKTKIVKKIKVSSATNVYKDKKTYLYGGVVDKTEDTRIEVTGYEIALQGDFANSFTVEDGSSVGKITGKLGASDSAPLLLNIKGGTVAEVDLDRGNVKVDDAKVGNIDTDHGDFTMTSGSTGDVAASGKVDITGGTVGSIGDDSSDINISSDNEDETTTVGAVKSKGTVKINSDESAVSVASLTATGDDANFTLIGDAVTVGKIDYDYYEDVKVTFDDFQGKIPAPINAKNGAIETSSEDDDVVVTGALTIDSLDLEDDSLVTFDNTVKVNTISGGTIKVGAGKLYVVDGVSGSPVLKLTDTTLAAGTVAFKADSDAVDVDDFDNFGFTLNKAEGSSVDTFKIATLSFAGVTINKSSSKIAVGYTETFKASAYPGGTSMPTGSKVVWDVDGDSDVFSYVTNADGSVTVKALAVNKDFASENKATLKATLQDADGYDLDDYDVAECELTSIATPEATSDTNSALSVAKGASYTMKVTSATQPTVTTGTAGVFSVALASKNGNNYFYKLTATGDAGKATGIFLNGTKIFVATVKAFAFTSDTTKPVTVKGAYTFKVTADATPTVSVGGAAFKLTFVSKTGNAYLYTITSAGAKGAAAGVYVNNSKVFVATVG